MIGNNTLELNDATVIAAVQMYLDSIMTPSARVRVIGVKREGSAYDGRFTVSVQRDVDTAPPTQEQQR